MVEQQRVAVRRGLGHAARAERAAGTADIFDHDLLAEILAHALRDEAGHGIGRAACRERHDHGDGALGIFGECGGCENRGAQRGGEKLAHMSFPSLVETSIRQSRLRLLT